MDSTIRLKASAVFLVEAVELRTFLVVAPDVLVVDELVAVVDSGSRRSSSPDSDDVFVVLLELRHQRREVRCRPRRDEGVEVLLGGRRGPMASTTILMSGAVLAGVELLRMSISSMAASWKGRL